MSNPVRTKRQGDSRGQSMVEYAFILTLVSIVAVVALMLIGQSVQQLFQSAGQGLG